MNRLPLLPSLPSLLRVVPCLSTALALLVTVALYGAEASAQPNVGVGVTGHHESGQIDGAESVGSDTADHSFDYRDPHRFGIHLQYIQPAGDLLYVGLDLRYYGAWRGRVTRGEQFDAPTSDFEFGHLFDTSGLLEWRMPVGDDSDAGLGTRLGASTVVPGGDFAREIDELQQRDIHVWHLPRVGWHFGAHLAATRKLSSRLNLRAELGAQWTMLALFNTEQHRGDTVFEREWTAHTLRGHLGLSLQWNL